MRRLFMVLLAVLLVIPVIPASAVSADISTARSDVLRCNLSTEYVWLTFDDGGSAANVRSILKTLSEHNVRGVFFPTGVWAAANPVLMQEIVGQGHIVGNHSYSHPDLTHLSKAGVKSQIKRGVAGNTYPKLLRPPFGAGAFGSKLQNVAKSMGYQVCFWTVDTRDWAGPSAKTIIKRVKKGQKGVTPPVKAGGVVLMHMHPKNTAKALPGVIKAIKGKGLELSPLH